VGLKVGLTNIGKERKRLGDEETKKVQSSKYRVQSWMKDKETKGLRMRKFHFIPFGFNIVSNSYGILSSVDKAIWRSKYFITFFDIK
jgi:hypothetical protein